MTSSPTETKTHAVNAWLVHVNQYRVDNPGTKYKDALKAAAATYTKTVVVKKEPTERKANPWMDHIAEWKAANPTWKDTRSYKDVLKLCKETYSVKPAHPSE
jgi:hypothetical protein